MPQTSKTQPDRIPPLDGLRGIAVLGVILAHFAGWYAHASGLVFKLAVWGGTGVDLFFVLSGFLITGILLKSKNSPHFLRNFYARRVLRIFPLYYATLLAIYVVAPWLHLAAWTPWKQTLWFWLYAQNIAFTFPFWAAPGPIHFWSLSVEEHYYFAWPFLVRALSRQRLLYVIAGAIAACFPIRIALAHFDWPLFTPARIDALAMGSALAIVASTSGGLARLVRPARWMLLFLAPLLAATQLLVSGKALLVVEILKYTLIALVYSSILVLAVEQKLGAIGQKVLCSSVLRSMGKYSYAMYVLHPFVMSWLHTDLALPARAFGLCLDIALIYLAARLSWVLLEERFLRFKQYFEYRGVPQAVASAV